jgi:hypothetical protein
MSGFEVAGAVGVAIQLAGVATKAFKLFSDMSRGFKDVDGTAARIHNELSSFKQSAKAARNNLKDLKIDNLDLKQALLEYEHTVAQLHRKMQVIQSKKQLVGRTKMWMELMSSDSEVTMLRRQLKRHTSELSKNFTLVELKGIREYQKRAHRKNMLSHRASEERSDKIDKKLDLSQRENMLSRRATEEGFDKMNKRLDLFRAPPDVKYGRQTPEKKHRTFEAPKDVRASSQTPAMSPIRLHDYGVQAPENKYRAFDAPTDVRASSQTPAMSPIRLHDTIIRDLDDS